MVTPRLTTGYADFVGCNGGVFGVVLVVVLMMESLPLDWRGFCGGPKVVSIATGIWYDYWPFGVPFLGNMLAPNFVYFLC